MKGNTKNVQLQRCVATCDQREPKSSFVFTLARFFFVIHCQDSFKLAGSVPLSFFVASRIVAGTCFPVDLLLVSVCVYGQLFDGITTGTSWRATLDPATAARVPPSSVAPTWASHSSGRVPSSESGAAAAAGRCNCTCNF